MCGSYKLHVEGLIPAQALLLDVDFHLENGGHVNSRQLRAELGRATCETSLLICPNAVQFWVACTGMGLALWRVLCYAACLPASLVEKTASPNCAR
eukprot:575708-Pelagomonas_calceolata.AAC.9